MEQTIKKLRLIDAGILTCVILLALAILIDIYCRLWLHAGTSAIWLIIGVIYYRQERLLTDYAEIIQVQDEMITRLTVALKEAREKILSMEETKEKQEQ